MHLLDVVGDPVQRELRPLGFGHDRELEAQRRPSASGCASSLYSKSCGAASMTWPSLQPLREVLKSVRTSSWPASTTSGRREYPPEQMEWYLDRSRLPFGILNNGQLWPLIPREIGQQQRRFQTELEFDRARFLGEWVACTDLGEQAHLVAEFMHLYLFLGPAGFRETTERKPLVRRAMEGSSEYRLGVGEGLKERTFEALRLCIEGLLSHKPNRLHPTVDLGRCRRHRFTLLYRLLFIMFAEDRQLLPYNA
jgi:hypothetical protein